MCFFWFFFCCARNLRMGKNCKSLLCSKLLRFFLSNTLKCFPPTFYYFVCCGSDCETPVLIPDSCDGRNKVFALKPIVVMLCLYVRIFIPFYFPFEAISHGIFGHIKWPLPTNTVCLCKSFSEWRQSITKRQTINNIHKAEEQKKEHEERLAFIHTK